MKFRAQMGMRSNPGFEMNSAISPLRGQGSIRGSFGVDVSAVTVGIGSIPVFMRVPFLKRKKPIVLLGNIGAFKIKVSPFSLKVREMALTATGIIGDGKGITIGTKGRVSCKTVMGVTGDFSGQIGTGGMRCQ